MPPLLIGGGIEKNRPPLAVSYKIRLILWQMRDPEQKQRTRMLVLLNKGTRWESGTRRIRSEVLYVRSGCLFCESRSLGVILRRQGSGAERNL